MAKKFRLAIMGATHVGKTVYLASYFYQTLMQGEGKYSVAVNPEAVEYLTELIKTLFEDKKDVRGTDTREDLSFSVGSLGIEIEMYDIPGGFTTNAAQWDQATRIADDLKNADGALFFISAEDLCAGWGKTIDETTAFITAIQKLREGGAIKQRADIPISIVFTKCDAIPSDMSVKELQEKIKGLLKRMRDEQREASMFFTKGKNIRTYRTISMGKWSDANVPPEDYKPENVLEPMQDMFENMINSKREHRGLHFKRTMAVILLIYGVIIVAGAWALDKYFFWDRAVTSAEQSASLARYKDAIDRLEDFKDRWTPHWAILPAYLKSGQGVDSLINDYYKKYEAEEFSKLEADIKAVDMTKIPSGDPARFRESAERVKNYLSNTKFFTISKENFEEVQNAEAYYISGLFLISNERELIAGLTSNDLYALANSQLEIMNRVPETWKEGVTGKADGVMREWTRTLPQDADIPTLSRYISDAEVLYNNPNIANELRPFLADFIEKCEGQKHNRWNVNTDEWLRVAVGNTDTESAIESLKTKKGDIDLPPENREKINQGIDDLYGKLAREWATDSNINVAELRKKLASHPDMPTNHRNMVEIRIESLIKEEIARELAKINKTTSLEELGKLVPELKELVAKLPEGREEVNKSLSAMFKLILGAEQETISKNVGEKLSNKDFTAASVSLESGISNLLVSLNDFAPFTDELDIRKAREIIDSGKKSKLTEIEESEYAFCKDSFNKIKNGYPSKNEIGNVIKNLEEFESRWKSSSKNSEIRKVIDFLQEVRNGVQATLVVVRGEFAETGRWMDTPDTYVRILENDKVVRNTNLKENDASPNFNERYLFTWTIGSEFTFIVYEVDSIGTNEGHPFFEVILPARGIFGYEKLTGILKQGNNTLEIKLEHNIPTCPWR